MKGLAPILILAFLILGQISEFVGRPTRLAADISEFYSFENDMEGWSINGAGLSPGDPTADEWAITRSQDIATDGLTASSSI